MPRNGSGTQSSPVSSFPAVANTLIESSKFNNVINDINASLTASISNDGQTPVLANLPMSGFKHTGASAASAAGEYVEYAQMIAAVIPAGTKMLFMQASAPTGWTEDATFEGRSLYIKDGTHAGASVGGSHNPLLMDKIPLHTHVFSGSAMGNHTHTDSGHTHSISADGYYAQANNYLTRDSASNGLPISSSVGYADISSNSAGTPAGTNANNSGANAVNWSPKYATAIVCTKN